MNDNFKEAASCRQLAYFFPVILQPISREGHGEWLREPATVTGVLISGGQFWLLCIVDEMAIAEETRVWGPWVLLHLISCCQFFASTQVFFELVG